MKLKAKNRMALVNKKNMKRLTGYFEKEGCIDFDLSWAVNYLVDMALKEITLKELEAIQRDMSCDGCEYAVQCNNGDEIYYCDHEGRTDDMGKLSLENLIESSPEWCPLKCMGNRNQDSDLIKMKTDIQLTDRMGNPIEIKVPQPEYSSEIFS